MQLFIATDGSDSLLAEELRRAVPGVHRVQAPGLIASVFAFDPAVRLPPLVFARQWLPDAATVQAESVREWAAAAFDALPTFLPDETPWRLHILPHYGVRDPGPSGARARFTQLRFQRRAADVRQPQDPPKTAAAGQHRCQLIAEALDDLLRRKRRHLLRQRKDSTAPFAADESFVQLLLTRPNSGFLSVAKAPLPSVQPRLLSPFSKGEAPPASDKAAPSRAFAKLIEAEQRLGRAIQSGETCVDLGAAPGSWTYVALQRGARVIAVDRAPLREDLMSNPGLDYQQGDAFAYEPPSPVDWLLCDVIAAPERSVQLVLDWTRHRWCRHFVVTIKFAGVADLDTLQAFKRSLDPLCPGFRLQRLSANKNEATVFGSLVPAA